MCISSGNGLVLKGGSEAAHTNTILHGLVQDALEQYVPRDTIALLQTREEINDLLELDSKYIDLIIPRGSNQLVKTIQQNSKSIPVLGHAEGICHVYLHKDADAQVAMKVVRDAKCDYPSACNAMETMLVHKDLLKTSPRLLHNIIEMFQMEKVKVNLGERAKAALGLDLPLVKNFNHEYSDLELAIETVENEFAAIDHINKNGSGHTESIITTDGECIYKFFDKIIILFIKSYILFRGSGFNFHEEY